MASQAYNQQQGLPATPGQSSQPQYGTYNQSSPPRSAGTDQQPPYNRRRQSQQAPQQSSHTAEPSQYKNQKSTRPKSRAFSFHSDKSHKTDLHETSAEKESKRLHTKADPTLAMQEMEPCKCYKYEMLLLGVFPYNTNKHHCSRGRCPSIKTSPAQHERNRVERCHWHPH